MSQTIRNAAQLNKALEKQCYYLADKVADKVKSNIEEFIKNYYHEYDPERYERTWRLLNSVIKSKPKKIANGYEVDVYIDTSIEYPSMWNGEHWNMGNTMFMANKGQHGRYATGYPHLWDEAYSDTISNDEIYSQFVSFMKDKGINLTIK